jgi:hypothetical protein
VRFFRFVATTTFGRVHAPVFASLCAHALPVDEFATRLYWNDLDAYMHQMTLYAFGLCDHHGDFDRQFMNPAVHGRVVFDRRLLTK